jgi:hypothetical protein
MLPERTSYAVEKGHRKSAAILAGLADSDVSAKMAADGGSRQAEFCDLCQTGRPVGCTDSEFNRHRGGWAYAVSRIAAPSYVGLGGRNSPPFGKLLQSHVSKLLDQFRGHPPSHAVVVGGPE